VVTDAVAAEVAQQAVTTPIEGASRRAEFMTTGRKTKKI